MKKQISTISLKTGKVISLSKNDSQGVVGGIPPRTYTCGTMHCETKKCGF